jgi:hypothetical protein
MWSTQQVDMVGHHNPGMDINMVSDGIFFEPTGKGPVVFI